MQTVSAKFSTRIAVYIFHDCYYTTDAFFGLPYKSNLNFEETFQAWNVD